jgi:hypothetical protein
VFFSAGLPRPGLKHIVSLLPHFRLGLCSSCALNNVTKKIQEIEDHIFGDKALRVCALLVYIKHFAKFREKFSACSSRYDALVLDVIWC